MRRAAALLVAGLASGCAKPPDTPPPVAFTPAPVEATAPAGARSGDRGSLYDLDVALVDQDGKPAKLDVDRGHVTLVSMFYSSCPAACPTLIADLKKIDAALAPEERAKTRVLLVSMDRDKDTPESFQALAKLHELDFTRWTMAEPVKEEDVRAVAAALGIKYRKLPDGNISHSTIVTVLRPDGALDLAVEGLGRDNADVVARLRELVESEAAGQAPSAGG